MGTYADDVAVLVEALDLRDERADNGAERPLPHSQLLNVMPMGPSPAMTAPRSPSRSGGHLFPDKSQPTSCRPVSRRVENPGTRMEALARPGPSSPCRRSHTTFLPRSAAISSAP